jgi:Leucine-rich repeat (LRR) protein
MKLFSWIALGLMASTEAKRKATGKRKRNEPKVNYCHKIMPSGENKSIFSDLDREECKEKKRRTGSKRKCTCKCLPGWKKGKSLDVDGNKVILCTVPNMIIERKPKLVQIVDTAAELADKTAETKTTPTDERRCTFAKDDVILDCSNTLYDTKTARKIIPPATLTKLWMENNHIDSLEKKDIRDTYQGLADLKEVSFKNNFIRKVEGKGVFKASGKLEYVDLSFNQISALSEVGIFKRNGNIRTLKLNNNMIKAMKKKLTKDLKNLEHLEVQNNRITRISGLILQSAASLLYADFSYNKIETISSKSFMNQAQLKELYLNNNNIKSINRKMLQKMQKLEVLDLSYNRIGYVDPDAGLVKAQGQNKNPAFLHDAFKGLVELKKLNLGHNQIAEIAGSQFAKMKNLIEINLDYNLLTDIPSTAFDECPELKYVFIRNNEIKSLPGNLFNQNPALKIAFLSHNEVDQIEDSLLQDKPELKRVDLGDNGFDNVGDIFEGSQDKLEYAYLYQNQVADVNENVLDAAPHLRAIDVGDNQLEDHKLGFIPKAIDGATEGNLGKINLQGNNLQNAQLNKVFEAASFNKLKDLIAKAKEDYAAAQAASNTL